MPELPDVTVYCEALAARIKGRSVESIRILNPFVLRTAVPPITELERKQVLDVRRLGKRIVIALEGDLFAVIHLMIAGRLRWLSLDAKPPGRISLAVFDFADGKLVMTEAGSKRRASIH